MKEPNGGKCAVASEEKNPRIVSNHRFVDRVKASVRSGYGLVPFIGSGVSAPSGVLMGMQFGEYIAWTVYRCVSGEGSKDSPERYWNLEAKGWPPSPSAAQTKLANDWIEKHFFLHCGKYGATLIAEKKAPSGAMEPFTVNSFDDLLGNKIVRFGFAGNAHLSGNVSNPHDLNRSLRRPLIPHALSSHFDKPHELDRPIRDFWKAVGHEDVVQRHQPAQRESSTSEEFLIEAAIRALADWTSALDFLARLEWPRSDGKVRPLLGDLNPSIVDRFNTHITQGKKPNLAHQMLCHLSGPARIRVILTTNFDRLMEDAFEQLNIPFRMHAVSQKGNLPSPDTVHSQHCIVKLHGDATETRADFSLNDEPSDKDKSRFAHYIAGYDTSPGAPLPPLDRPRFAPSHLFVCGFSAQDARCVKMMKHYLDTCQEGHIYWICFDLPSADALFKETFWEAEYQGKITSTVTQRPDLLFNDLYQKLTLSLTQGGFSYQFFPNVPPEPVPLDAFLKEKDEKQSAAVGSQKTASDANAEPQKEQDVASAPKTGKSAPDAETQKGPKQGHMQKPADSALEGGSPKALAEAVSELNKCFDDNNEKYVVYRQVSGVLATLREIAKDPGKLRCKESIWLELEDYLSPMHIAHEILLIIALKLGNYQLDHIDLAPLWNEERISFSDWCEAWKNHCKLLLEHWNRGGKEWLLILYGRNGTGGCSGWTNRHWDPTPVQPGTDKAPKLDTTKENLPSLLKTLAQIGFRVIIAPVDRARKERDRQKQQSIRNLSPGTPCYGDHYQSESIFRRAPDGETPFEYRQFSGDAENQWGVYCNVQSHGSEVARGFETIIADVNRYWVLGDADDFIDRHKDQDLSPAKKKELARQLLELMERDEKRRSFLYSCLLMRQARQYSAMFNEVLIPCEERFNAAGFDNDWQRSIRLDAYLEKLVKQKFFLLKPGGFWWTYRDLRLGIRELLEKEGSVPTSHLEIAIEWADGDEELKQSISTMKRYASMHHFRAESHFYIGDWYARVFHTTSHAQPFFETLHHFAQSALMARYAVRRGDFEHEDERATDSYDRARHRIHLWQQAMHRLIKALRVGQDTVRFWCQEALAKLWFGVEHRNGDSLDGEEPPRPGEIVQFGGAFVLNQLESEWKWHQGQVEGRTSEEWNVLRHSCETLLKRLRAEFELILEIIRDAPRHSGVPNVHPPEEEDFRKIVAGFRDPDKLSKADPSFAKSLLGRLAEKAEGLPFGTWLTTDKEGVCPKEMLYGLLDVGLCKSESKPQSDDKNGIIHWVNDSAHGLHAHQEQRKLFHALMIAPNIVKAGRIELLGEFIYALMRRAKLAQHTYERDHLDAGEAKIPFLQAPEAVKLWIQVCVLSNLLLQVRSLIPPDEYSVEYRVRLRTLTNYGLALGRLGRFFEAHRRLNEATALLVQRSGFREHQEHVRLILRRAEVSLLEARHIRWLQSEHQDFLKSDADAAKRQARQGPYERAKEQWKRQYMGIGVYSDESDLSFDDIDRGLTGLYSKHRTDDGTEGELQRKRVIWRLERLRIGRLDEAWSQVERAEKLMRGRSQSKLWWSRLHALQLRIIGEHYYGHDDHGECDIAFSSLAFRERYDARDRVRDCFLRGVAAAPRDVFRYIRLLHYLIDAMRTAVAIEIYPRKFGAEEKADWSKRIQACRESVKHTWVHLEAMNRVPPNPSSPESDLLTRYARRTLEQLEKAISGVD